MPRNKAAFTKTTFQSMLSISSKGTQESRTHTHTHTYHHFPNRSDTGTFQKPACKQALTQSVSVNRHTYTFVVHECSALIPAQNSTRLQQNKGDNVFGHTVPQTHSVARRTYAALTQLSRSKRSRTLTSHGQGPENYCVYVERERPGLVMQELDYFQQPSFPRVQANPYCQEDRLKIKLLGKVID